MIDQSNKDLLLGFLMEFFEENKYKYGSGRATQILMLTHDIIKGQRCPSIIRSSIFGKLKKKSWFSLLKPYICSDTCTKCGDFYYTHIDYVLKSPIWPHEDQIKKHNFVPIEMTDEQKDLL